MNFAVPGGKETKIFDPKDGFAPLTDPLNATDASVTWRGDRWWMVTGGKVRAKPGIHLFSASLPPNAPLSAAGWRLTADPHDPTKVGILAGYENSHAWDLKGGRHCPCYVKGRDSKTGDWIERIYYAGSAEHLWGPYTIGYLEWDGSGWRDQPAPAFVANEDWERGSVYEPNLIFHDGKWKMWYAAGSNPQEYIVQGFAESADGRSGWTKHALFAQAEQKMFDFHVFLGRDEFEAVFSRVPFGNAPASDSGLWWSSAPEPYGNLESWSKPVQIMTGAPCEWHASPWKPSVQYADEDSDRLFVFLDGMYQTGEQGPFPYAFTLGCLEIQRPQLAGPHHYGRERS